MISGLIPSLAQAQVPPNVQARVAPTYYTETDEQYRLFQNAVRRAKRADKPLLITIGYESCPWCASLGQIFYRSLLAAPLNERFVLEQINLRGDVQLVIDVLKNAAGITEKIQGYPFIFVYNPVTKKAVGISTGPLEYNFPHEGIYGHYSSKIMAEISDAQIFSGQCKDVFRIL